MDRQAKAVIKIMRGNERPYSDVKGAPKLTRGHFDMIYDGDIQGDSVLEELKCYLTESYATVYGLERVTCQIGERVGSFVMEHHGKFENGVVSSERRVVPQSGTGDLKGIDGTIHFESDKAEEFQITFQYSIDEEMATFLRQKEEEDYKFIEEEMNIADQWFDASNDQDVDALLEVTAPTIEISGPRGSGYGKDLLVEWLERAGLTLETQSIYGKRGSLVYDQKGIWRDQEGKLAGQMNVATFLKVRDEKVSFISRFDDLEKALRAAGLREEDKVL